VGDRPLPKTAMKVVTGVTILLVAWIAWGSFTDPEAMWAPGNLSRAHVMVTACTQCHIPFHGPSPTKCTGCHSEEWFSREAKPEGEQRHVDFIRQQRSCLACHTEHQGR